MKANIRAGKVISLKNLVPTRCFQSSAFRNNETPLEAYDSRVKSGRIRDDPYQRKVLLRLGQLYKDLCEYHPPKIELPSIKSLEPKTGISTIFGSIFSHKTHKPAIGSTGELNVKGIYLYGDVGCGKTMLMDLFYDTVPPHLTKNRVHFHQFMQSLHKRSHNLKKEYHSELDVIPYLAAEITRESTVLCFDEFQVTDVADAMLLRRLLTLLLSPEYGLVLFGTSNRAPDDLYINGIQRVSFIPAIQLIKKKTKVVYLNSPTDYRKIPKPMSDVYLFPAPGVKYFSKAFQTKVKKHIEHCYSYFNQENSDKKIATDFTLSVWGRTLRVLKCSYPYVAQFTFSELCGKPLAAGDYLTLANAFQSFIVTDIPYLSVDARNQVRRFITFLDAVYDAHGRLAVTAAAPFKDLFVEPEDLQKDNFLLYKREQQQGTKETFEEDELVTKHGFDKSIAKKASMFANDEERFAFARALSRLSQMSSKEWIESSHRKKKIPKL